MSGRSTVPAWSGLIAGVGVLGVVGALLQRTMRPTLEIRRYADDVAASVQAIAANTDVAGEVARLRGLTAQLRPPAGGGEP